jgi:hypothetical protein
MMYENKYGDIGDVEGRLKVQTCMRRGTTRDGMVHSIFHLLH